MADRQTSGPRRSEALPGAEDDARIEHLLVTGLDHYFADEFEAAINLWTRVLFLDRNHDRARAYIDRARSARPNSSAFPRRWCTKDSTRSTRAKWCAPARC